jgi:hypothetical protein
MEGFHLDLLIRPPVDLDVVQILETMSVSNEARVAASCLVDQMDPFPPVFDCPDRALSEGRHCLDDHFDAEDQLDSVPEFEDDDAKIVTLQLAEIPINAAVMTGTLEDQQVLRFSCLGSDRLRPPVPLGMVLNRVLTFCFTRLVRVTKSGSWFMCNRMLMSMMPWYFFDPRDLRSRSNVPLPQRCPELSITLGISPVSFVLFG